MELKTVGIVLGIIILTIVALIVIVSIAFKNMSKKWPEIDKLSEEKLELINQCETGSFSYANITRDYMLYRPKNSDGTPKKNIPLMVWNIGGTEYELSIQDVAKSNHAVVCMDRAGVECAVLVFAISNPDYEYSASLEPEKIMQIDKNNALQAAFIQTLIDDGSVDANHIYCAGASSGGGATVRFCMQFPNLFVVAVPCCSMDPIVPIHYAEEEYDGQFVHDLKEAFKGQVYRWNGIEMVLDNIDTEAFLQLPITFVHGREDWVCKVTSSISMYEARKELGAENDNLCIYEHDKLLEHGIDNKLMAHCSWVPLLAEFGEGTPMNWMLQH